MHISKSLSKNTKFSSKLYVINPVSLKMNGVYSKNGRGIFCKNWIYFLTNK